jgi:hypothetical protein
MSGVRPGAGCRCPSGSSLRFSSRLVRTAARAGARLQRTPVSTAMRRAKPATPALMEIASLRGMDSGSSGTVARKASAARPRPWRPPARLSTRPSLTHSRRIVPAWAPSARRTACSRRRRIVRTSSKVATLAQAISSTMQTARKSVRSRGRTPGDDGFPRQSLRKTTTRRGVVSQTDTHHLFFGLCSPSTRCSPNAPRKMLDLRLS